MELINCYHETEGFCLFEGFCEYKHELLTGDTICHEYCKQYIRQFYDGKRNLSDTDKLLIEAVMEHEKKIGKGK